MKFSEVCEILDLKIEGNWVKFNRLSTAIAFCGLCHKEGIVVWEPMFDFSTCEYLIKVPN